MSDQEILSTCSKAGRDNRATRIDVLPRSGSTGKILKFYVDQEHIGTIEIQDAHAFGHFTLDHKWLFDQEKIKTSGIH